MAPEIYPVTKKCVRYKIIVSIAPKVYFFSQLHSTVEVYVYWRKLFQQAEIILSISVPCYALPQLSECRLDFDGNDVHLWMGLIIRSR
jgi:hypothetical protein